MDFMWVAGGRWAWDCRVEMGWRERQFRDRWLELRHISGTIWKASVVKFLGIYEGDRSEDS